MSDETNVPTGLINSVIRRLETDKTCRWRTQMGVTKFQCIVEDVLDAALQCDLHLNCVSESDFNAADEQFRHDLDKADELIDAANQQILDLEDKIRLLEIDLDNERDR